MSESIFASAVCYKSTYKFRESYSGNFDESPGFYVIDNLLSGLLIDS